MGKSKATLRITRIMDELREQGKLDREVKPRRKVQQKCRVCGTSRTTLVVCLKCRERCCVTKHEIVSQYFRRCPDCPLKSVLG